MLKTTTGFSLAKAKGQWQYVCDRRKHVKCLLSRRLDTIHAYTLNRLGNYQQVIKYTSIIHFLSFNVFLKREPNLIQHIKV